MVEKLEEVVGQYSVSYRFKNVSDQLVWNLSSVYGPNIDSIRHLMWEELAGIFSWWTLPWVRFPLERLQAENFTQAIHKSSDFITSHELLDTPLEGGLYTWSHSS